MNLSLKMQRQLLKSSYLLRLEQFRVASQRLTLMWISKGRLWVHAITSLSTVIAKLCSVFLLLVDYEVFRWSFWHANQHKKGNYWRLKIARQLKQKQSIWISAFMNKRLCHLHSFMVAKTFTLFSNFPRITNLCGEIF